MRKTATCFLLAVCLFCTNAVTTNAQTSSNVNQSENKLDKQSEEIKKKIEKIGQGKDITIFLIDGKEFYGSVKSIESDLVLINEVDAKKLIEIKYAEIKKVSKCYAEIGSNGTRRKPSKRKIFFAYAAVFSIIAIMGVGYSRE